MLLVDDFHSCAHQLGAKCMNEPQVWPLLCTLKMQMVALCNRYSISKTTMDTTLMKSMDAVKNVLFAPFLQINTSP